MQVETGACAAREKRELESIIDGANVTHERMVSVAANLRDIRRRLLGMDENEPDSPKVAEVAGAEISELRVTLRDIDTTLQRIEGYVANLENL